MIDNSYVILEDNIKYQVIDKINNNNSSYIYLVNIDEDDDIVVRKEITQDNEHYLIGLDDLDELEISLDLFLEKNFQQD